MDTAKCLDCGSMITFSRQPRTGNLVNCPSCGTELQVVWLDPLELDWPYYDDYDDDEDDFDDDDDDFDYDDD